MKNHQKSTIFHEKPQKFFKNPKYYLKDFLIYLGIIDESVYMKDVFGYWFKSVLGWIITILVTGSFINVPLMLLFSFPLL
jgi:hypothetical protein